MHCNSLEYERRNSKERKIMNCPRCGTKMQGGVCPECGFPVNQIRKNNLIGKYLIKIGKK